MSACFGTQRHAGASRRMPQASTPCVNGKVPKVTNTHVTATPPARPGRRRGQAQGSSCGGCVGVCGIDMHARRREPASTASSSRACAVCLWPVRGARGARADRGARVYGLQLHVPPRSGARRRRPGAAAGGGPWTERAEGAEGDLRESATSRGPRARGSAEHTSAHGARRRTRATTARTADARSLVESRAL